MAKRIKRVFSNASQVLHLWANQSQADARSANVFFEGERCYSYGRHYELGRLIKHKGVKVALINTRGYSVTTSKHIGYAQGAVSHLLSLDCPTGEMSVKAALEAQRASLLKDMEAVFKSLKFYKGNTWGARSRWGLRARVEEFNKACAKLKESKFKIKVTAAYIKKHDAHVQARIKRMAELEAYNKSPEGIAKREAAAAKREGIRLAEYQAREAAREAERAAYAKARAEQEAREAAELPERIAEFRAGHIRRVEGLEYEIIRVRNGRVETSQGAEVPLGDALALYNSILAGRAEHGQRVGGFTLDAVIGADDTTEVRIGCHTILLSEARAVLGPIVDAIPSRLQLVPEVSNG